MTARNRLLYQRRAAQINQIFILPPSLCNIAEVISGHHVALLTGRVQDSFGGSGLSFFSSSALSLFSRQPGLG